MSTRLIVLLRGINVGRNKRVAMGDLRQLLVKLGYSQVQTHLQSGNAVLTSPWSETGGVAAAIEQALMRDIGVESTVILRTAGELAAVVEANPLRDVATVPSRHLVGFLAGQPEPGATSLVGELDAPPDGVRLLGRELYLWCPHGILASPLSKVNWDRRVGVPVTMRNWNTVLKLAELAL